MDDTTPAAETGVEVESRDAEETSTNREAAKHRHAAKAAKAELDQVRAELEKFKAAEAARQADLLAQQGKFKELYEAEALKAKALETEATNWRSFRAAQLEQLEKTVPADVLAKLPAGLTGEDRLRVLEALNVVSGQKAQAEATRPAVVLPQTVSASVAGSASVKVVGGEMSFDAKNQEMRRISADTSLTKDQRKAAIDALAARPK